MLRPPDWVTIAQWVFITRAGETISNVQHSAAKAMEVEEIKAQDLRAAPPVLPWRDFANWIGM
ncbi:hypothetical protein ACLBYN_05420, partial [Pseudomonas aeruginosa]